MSLQALKTLFSPSDEQLMWRVQSRDDAEAFARLVGRWQAPIQRLCFRMIGDVHRAEDLTQEVFTRLFAHRKNYQTSRKFSTYLWRIALNRCYSELRRSNARSQVEIVGAFSDEASPGTPISGGCELEGPDEQAATADAAREVRIALTNLPDHLRAVVVLRHYEDLKFREIAETLDLPEGTVKTRMTEALDRLGHLLRGPLDQQRRPRSPRRTASRNQRCLL